MNKIKLKLQNTEPVAIALVLFVFSIIIGIVVSRIGANLLSNDFERMNETYFKQILQAEINYGDLFWYILFQNLKRFFIFLLLCVTILALPYMVLCIGKTGFELGFLLSALMMEYHGKGLLLMLVYVFPQGIIYIPVILYSLKMGYDIAVNSGTNNSTNIHNTNMLRKYGKLVILLITGICLGTLLETFLGSFLLRKVLQLF